MIYEKPHISRRNHGNINSCDAQRKSVIVTASVHTGEEKMVDET